MPTFDLYTTDPGDPHWQVPATGKARFSWEYDHGRDRLLALYQKGKDKQWDGQKRIDWDLEVDPHDPLGTPDESISVYGTKYWAKFTDQDKGELRKHLASWQFSLFLARNPGRSRPGGVASVVSRRGATQGHDVCPPRSGRVCGPVKGSPHDHGCHSFR
jgi:hypothetical protein